MAEPGDEGRPPFFRTWRGAYVFVLAVLAVEIVALAYVSWNYA
jgi:hypothetical protein